MNTLLIAALVLLGSYLAFKGLWAWLRLYVIRTQTVLGDIPTLRLAPPVNKIQGTAVIAGGRYGSRTLDAMTTADDLSSACQVSSQRVSWSTITQM